MSRFLVEYLTEAEYDQMAATATSEEELLVRLDSGDRGDRHRLGSLEAKSVAHALNMMANGEWNRSGLLVWVSREGSRVNTFARIPRPDPGGVEWTVRNLIIERLYAGDLADGPERLAMACGMSHGTIRRFLNYEGSMTGDNIDKVLKQLGVAVHFTTNRVATAGEEANRGN